MKVVSFLIIAMLISTPAFAGKEMCKDVDIKVKNELDSDIKVVDIEYWDYTVGTLRGEYGVKNKTVLENKTETWNRKLENALNEPIAVRVQYKVFVGGKTKGGRKPSDYSTTEVCTKGETYEVFVR